MEQADAIRNYPGGIGEEHTRRQSFIQHYLGWVALALLGALLALSLTGVLGGHPNPTVTAESERADLAVNTPQVLRSGEFFEMRFVCERSSRSKGLSSR